MMVGFLSRHHNRLHPWVSSPVIICFVNISSPVARSNNSWWTGWRDCLSDLATLTEGHILLQRGAFQVFLPGFHDTDQPKRYNLPRFLEQSWTSWTWIVINRPPAVFKTFKQLVITPSTSWTLIAINISHHFMSLSRRFIELTQNLMSTRGSWILVTLKIAQYSRLVYIKCAQ